MADRDWEEGPSAGASDQDNPAGHGSVWEEAVRADDESGDGNATGQRHADREGYASRDGNTGGDGTAGREKNGRESHAREDDRWRPGASQGRGPSRPASDRRQSRPRQPGHGSEVLTDFQRWLLRSSAKNMRREISGQVRKTLGGGRPDRADVWDTATTEIPPEVGESPECQWCPICRAARRMRESGPGLGDQLWTAGDAVAAAVQDAMRAFDSVLTRPAGRAQQSARRDSTGRRQGAAGRDEAGESDVQSADRDEWVAARDAWAAAHGALIADPDDDPDTGPSHALNGEPDGADEPHDRG